MKEAAVKTQPLMTYHHVSADIQDSTEVDLEVEGTVLTEKDPYAIGALWHVEYTVELDGVWHKRSKRPVDISALPDKVRQDLEARVLQEFLEI